MGSNLVIVAIPKQDDRVWKVSSEKVPHLTILHLGDVDQVSNLDQIMLFVEHAANTSLNQFWLPVDRRGELGEAKADVLFFRKGYDTRAVRTFRSLLLKDPNIKSAYDAAKQFEMPPEVGQPGQPWIPHMTLGYPDSPAKPMPDDWSTIYDVNFDKVAVWDGDFSGPEFQLKDYWEEFDEMEVPLDVAMSEIQHHGVKGMRWGVTKQPTSHGGHIRVSNKTNVATISNASGFGVVGAALFVPGVGAFGAFLHPRFRAEFKAAGDHNRLVRKDKKWKKRIDKSKKGVEVHNAAADEINAKIGAFNNDKRWKNVDLTKDPAKQKAYDDAVTKELINPAYANAAVKVYGSKSPSERYTFEVKDASKGELKLTDALAERRKAQLEGLKHADEDDDPTEDIVVPFTISRTATGHIQGFAPDVEGASAEHTIDLGMAFLEHYGVKGMKWGVRKPPPSPVAPTATSRVPHGTKRKTQIKVEGGENHDASPDAIKIAEHRAKLAKSGPKALSNQELREVATRLQLEQQVKQLNSPAGLKFTKNILRNQGQQIVDYGAREGRKKALGF